MLQCSNISIVCYYLQLLFLDKHHYTRISVIIKILYSYKQTWTRHTNAECSQFYSIAPLGTIGSNEKGTLYCKLNIDLGFESLNYT